VHTFADLIGRVQLVDEFHNPIDLKLIDCVRPDSIARSTGSLGSARTRSFVGVQGSDEILQIRAIQDPIEVR
jgi:hypothetical protein